MNTETIIKNFSNFLNSNLNSIEDCLKNHPEYTEYLSIENFYFQARGAYDMAICLIMETPDGGTSGIDELSKIWGTYLKDFDKITTEEK